MSHLSRRDWLRWCGATAAVSLTARSTWAQSLQADSLARIPSTANMLWTNQHLNLSMRVRRHFDVWNRSAGSPATASGWREGLAQMRAIVDHAEYAQLRVRAAGARWSLSPVAVCPDIMINTTPLNHHTVGLPAEYVSTSSVDPPRLVFAQCGTGVGELSATLEACGLSLPTSGGSNGQTICGAIATGTHGSARRVGAMQDFILGLHVLLDGGRQVWIERASRPVVSEAFCAHLGATLVRDDAVFRAAVVSFGCFGVMHAVLFEAEPIYLLEVHRRECEWNDIAHAVCELDTDALGLPYPGEEPFHLDAALNPYCRGSRGPCTIVTAMYKRPYRKLPPRADRHQPLVAGADLLGAVGGLSAAAPAAIPAVARALFTTMKQSVERPPLGTHGEVFGPTGFIGKSLSMEIGVDLGRSREAIDTVIEAAHEFAYPGTIGLRFVQRSDALLAFTRFDTTCLIEVTGAGGSRTRSFYDHAWAALDARRIPYTLHWGKVHNTSTENIRARLGTGVDDWIAARRTLLGAAGRAMFCNDLVASCGLGD